MITGIVKYNPFKWISSLRLISEDIAGKKCFLDRRNGLHYYDSNKSLRKDGACVEMALGKSLMDSGKFPRMSKITFPRCSVQVRDFIRLVVRTRKSLYEAAADTGTGIEDLSKYTPNI